MITRLSTFAIACLYGLGVSAAEQASEIPVNDGTPPAPTDNLERIPGDAYNQSPAIGIPYHSLFRETSVPNLNTIRDVSLTPSFTPAESVSAGARVDLPDFRGRFPLLQRGFAPESADLKIGRLYFKLRHISAAVLASDNINRSATNRESGALSIISIGGQVMAQITDRFSIAASGSYVYFPFEGRGGFSGSLGRYNSSFGISNARTLQTQIAWEPTIFGLPFVIADEFRVGLFRFSNTLNDSFEYGDDGGFDATTHEGAYTLGGRRFNGNKNFNNNYNEISGEHIYYSNLASISTSGTLPGEHIFNFRASHENLWYQDDFSGQYNLPSQRDRASLHIQSVRESLRFKPYLHYDFNRRNNPEITYNTFRVGMKGPITDLITTRGEAGYSVSNDRSHILWRLGLYHTASPYMHHALEYNRGISDFNDEISENVIYRIYKTLGPDLSGSASISYHRVEDLYGASSSRKEWRTGSLLSYHVSPRTQLSLRTYYANIDYDDGSGSATSWLTRFNCEHRFLERLHARFIYQHEHRNADRRSNSYDENLAYLSLSWLFE